MNPLKNKLRFNHDIKIVLFEEFSQNISRNLISSYIF